MGIGASIFLLAAGAILSWGVETDPEGINVGTIGAILMVVGLLGLLMSLLFFEDWRPWGRRDYVDDRRAVRRRDVYVDEEPYVRQTVVEDEPLVRRSFVEQEPVVRRRVVSNRRVTY